MTATTVPPVPAASAALSFTGRPREFLGLLVKGSLLQIPTFGFYRFWLITKMRRHLWANTKLSGESFEYTGTAKEILIGFLIAIAVLIPVNIGYSILGVMAEEKRAFLSLPFVLLMYALAQFARYRAFRYRASRTVLRGIRFWASGSGWRFGAMMLKWSLLTVLSAGLAAPWAYAAEERYRMQHLHWGTLQGDFVGTGAALFKRIWWLWAYLVFGVIGGMALAGIVLKDRVKSDPLVYAIPVLLLLAALPAYPIFLASLTRWKIEGIRIGRVSFVCGLRRRDLIILFAKLIGSWIGLVVCGVAAPAAVVWFVYRTGLSEQQSASGGLLTFYGLLFLTFLGFGVIQRYFLSRGFWAVIASSITVVNPEAIDEAAAAGGPSGSFGEGLADALDFSVGL